MAILSPVKKSALPEQIANKLRRAILSGHIRPGERLIEKEIAAKMKTSRAPVREAFSQLKQEGLIIKRWNHGAMAVSLSEQDAEEVWRLRAALEILALEYVRERVTDQNLAKMKKIVKDISYCIKQDFSLEKFVDLDLKFHEALVNASYHKQLISCWQSLKFQIWLLIFSHGVKDLITIKRKGGIYHQRIIETIYHKDLNKGIRILREHLENSYANFISAQKTKNIRTRK